MLARRAVRFLARTRVGSGAEPAALAHCRAVLSGYKKPKAVEFLPELPTNAYGKVLKRELRQNRTTDLRSA